MEENKMEKAKCNICGEIIDFDFKDVNLLEHLLIKNDAPHLKEYERIQNIFFSCFLWGDELKKDGGN